MHHPTPCAGSSPVVEVWRGQDAVERALRRHDDLVALTPFQTTSWLSGTYRALPEINHSEPMLVCVRMTGEGAIRLAVPLVVVRENGLTEAGFPDFGIADYGAPLVCPLDSPEMSADDVAVLWNGLCKALDGVDLLSLTNMPLDVQGSQNPLAFVRGALPSSHRRFVLELQGSVDEFLASRGKKYRKEVERCYRLLSTHGDWSFVRAETPDTIDAAFRDLNRLQEQRWSGEDGQYQLKRTAIATFYRELLSDDAEGQRAQIFTLKSGNETIAVLYGVQFGPEFTLLRIASADGSWRRLSPGRLIVVEAMRHFVDREIKIFDLGIGDYAFKRGLGAKAHPLVDVECALTIKAKPHVMLMQAKGWLRKYPRLLHAAKAARQKMSS